MAEGLKKIVMGGFLSLIGSMWAIMLGVVGANNLTSSWSTPPGRFLTTMSELGLMPFFAVAALFVMAGIVLMVIGCCKKES